jgi:hypothetical protein
VCYLSVSVETRNCRLIRSPLYCIMTSQNIQLLEQDCVETALMGSSFQSEGRIRILQCKEALELKDRMGGLIVGPMTNGSL